LSTFSFTKSSSLFASTTTPLLPLRDIRFSLLLSNRRRCCFWWWRHAETKFAFQEFFISLPAKRRRALPLLLRLANNNVGAVFGDARQKLPLIALFYFFYVIARVSLFCALVLGERKALFVSQIIKP